MAETIEDSPVVAPKGDGELAAGEVIAGRYRVVRFIARGGMGEVYEVEDTLVGTRVALKALRAVAGDRGGERLRREARLARKITHANVCRLFDLGMHGERPFLTMELLDGETLADRLARGPLPPAEARTVAAGLAAALDAAHAAGVLHRDLKPGNVILVGDRPVVTDFGLAREEGPDGAPRVTREGSFVGTPEYMSPEQIEGREATARSDVYAFGIVLYELVTGELPFAGPTTLAIAARRLREPPPLVGARAPGWDAVIGRCLALEPEQRFASAGAAVEALGRRSRRWLWAPVLAAAAVVATLLYVPPGAAARLSSPASPATRRVIAVIDLPGGSDGAALAEGVRIGMTGDRLRIVPGWRDAEARADLGLSGSSLDDSDARRRLATGLAVDDLVLVVAPRNGRAEAVVVAADGRELGRARAAGDLPTLARTLAVGAADRLGAAAQVPGGRVPGSADSLRAAAEGVDHWGARRIPEARDAFARAAAAGADSPELWARLSQLELVQRDPAAAAESASRALAVSSDLALETRLDLLAARWEATNDLEPASFALHLLLAAAPDSLEAGARAARLESRLGHNAAARAVLDGLRAGLSPHDDLDLYGVYVRLAMNTGDLRTAHDMASRLVVQARALGRPLLASDGLRLQAAAESDTGDLSTAVALAEDAVTSCAATRFPERCDVPSWVVRAEVLLELGRLDRAAADLDRVIGAVGRWAKFAREAGIVRGRLLVRRGDLDGAVKQVAQLASFDDSSDYDLLRGELGLARGEREYAARMLADAVARAREDGDQAYLASGLIELAEIEVGVDAAAARRRCDEALAVSTALGLRLDGGRARRCLAAVDLAADDPAAALANATAALAELRAVAAGGDDEVLAAARLAEVLIAGGRLEEARKAIAGVAPVEVETVAVRRALADVRGRL